MPAVASPRSPTAGAPRVLWATAFRPFFLLGAALVVALVPLWVLSLAGVVRLHTSLPPVTWHAHEMIWGFAAAIIAGFLLTAVRNWTGRETASGPALLALVALWLAGRGVAGFGGSLPLAIGIAVDVAFLPAVALTILRPMWFAKSHRNLAFPVLLLVLAGADLAVHLEAAGVIELAPAGFRVIALDAVAFIIAIVGGRVVPMFTRNAIPASNAHADPRLDRIALGSLGALLVGDLGALAVPAVATAAAALAVVAGGANLLRMRPWGTLATGRAPIVWVLHVGYAWLGLGLVLRGLSTFIPAISPTMGTHALTVGAIGTMCLGMMSRVSLGHTGRPLHVGPAVVAAYVLVTAAAIIRVAAPLLGPWMPRAWTISGLAFAGAFAIFLGVYWPILTRPRADGRPG